MKYTAPKFNVECNACKLEKFDANIEPITTGAIITGGAIIIAGVGAAAFTKYC